MTNDELKSSKEDSSSTETKKRTKKIKKTNKAKKAGGVVTFVASITDIIKNVGGG